MKSQAEFQLVVAGEVECCRFLPPQKFASMSFVINSPNNETDWRKVSGENTGVSARAYSSICEIIWNVPFACTFSSTNPAGWPRMVITLLVEDWFGRDVIGGYGCVTVPCQPGRHVREIRLCAPSFSSTWLRLINYILGKRPTLTNSFHFLTEPQLDEREHVITAQTGACVKINFNIALLNTDKFNFLF